MRKLFARLRLWWARKRADEQPEPHEAYVTTIDTPMFRPNCDDPGCERRG